MATPDELATRAVFRVLRSVDVDPELAYEATEEIRRQAGENVISTLGAKIDAQGARIDAQITEIKAEVRTHGSRIEDLRHVVWRVIWLLIVLLAVHIFGLLYYALTG